MSFNFFFSVPLFPGPIAKGKKSKKGRDLTCSKVDGRSSGGLCGEHKPLKQKKNKAERWPRLRELPGYTRESERKKNARTLSVITNTQVEKKMANTHTHRAHAQHTRARRRPHPHSVAPLTRRRHCVGRATVCTYGAHPPPPPPTDRTYLNQNKSTNRTCNLCQSLPPRHTRVKTIPIHPPPTKQNKAVGAKGGSTPPSSPFPSPPPPPPLNTNTITMKQMKTIV